MILVEGAARKAGIRGSRVKSGEKSTDTDLMNSRDFKARKRKASTHDVLEDEHTKTSKLSAPSQEKPRPKDNDDLPNELSSHDFTREHQIQITGVNDSGDAYIWPAPMTSFDMTPFAPPIRKGIRYTMLILIVTTPALTCRPTAFLAINLLFFWY